MSGENEREDEDLLRRLEGGDQRALTELFARHCERLRLASFYQCATSTSSPRPPWRRGTGPSPSTR